MGKLKKIVREKKRTFKKIRQKLTKGERVNRDKLAEYLRWRLPPSEQWFQRKWKEIGMIDTQDLFNRPYGPFIPDCINERFRYVIEIDGSSHENIDRKERDERRDRYFSANGFFVFRLKSFDNIGFDKVVQNIKNLRNSSIRLP